MDLSRNLHLTWGAHTPSRVLTGTSTVRIVLKLSHQSVARMEPWMGSARASTTTRGARVLPIATA
jgi:hypothetical protein